MAPAQEQASTPQSTAKMAADTLWEYQLRKENKAILDQIRKIGEKRDADVSENMKRVQEAEKRRLALEARVAELEKEHKLQEAREAEQKKETAAKLAEMEKFLRSRLTDDELRKVMSGGQPMNTPTEAASDTHPPYAALRPSNPNSRLNVEERSARQGANVSKTAAPIPREEPPVPPQKFRQVANRRPSARNNHFGGIPPAAGASSASTSSASPGTPKLAQKHKSLKQYYETANNLFNSMTMKDMQMEFDFISAFISGLESKRSRDKAIQGLQTLHPARNRRDGGVEIMCRWEDVPAGLRRGGLDVTGGAKEEIRKKKRTLNPRTGLETGFVN